jgi:hypothetical protein
MFATFFGIPLSVGALVSGIALGLGTKWGVLRYPWVVAKLALIISVMVVGGAVIGPALNVMLSAAQTPRGNSWLREHTTSWRLPLRPGCPSSSLGGRSDNVDTFRRADRIDVSRGSRGIARSKRHTLG